MIETCCDPRNIVRDEQGIPKAWSITLNEYQRSNLIWLLCDVIGYDKQSALVNGLHTGDWVGEIANAIRINENGNVEKSSHPPNGSDRIR